MTSVKQRAANCANAAKSTGPRTEKGKAASAQNARTHGLRAAHFTADNEELEEFEALLQGLRHRFRPTTAFAEFLVEKLARAVWRDRRFAVIEREALDALATANARRGERAVDLELRDVEANGRRLLLFGRYLTACTNEIKRLYVLLDHERVVVPTLLHLRMRVPSDDGEEGGE